MNGKEVGESMSYQLSNPVLHMDTLLRTQQALHTTSVLSSEYAIAADVSGTQTQHGLYLHHPNLSPDNTGQVKGFILQSYISRDTTGIPQ